MDTVSIGEILSSPGKYEGERVAVKGVVKEVLAGYALQSLSRVFSRLRITDGSGSILVLVSPVPREVVLPGDLVSVTGVFSSQFYEPLILSSKSRGGEFKIVEIKEYFGVKRDYNFKIGPFYLYGLLSLTKNDEQSISIIVRSRLDPERLTLIASREKNYESILDIVKAMTLSSFFYPKFDLEAMKHTRDVIDSLLRTDLPDYVRGRLKAYLDLLKPIFSEEDLKSLFEFKMEETIPEILPAELDVNVEEFKKFKEPWFKVSLLINYLKSPQQYPIPKITIVKCRDEKLRIGFIKAIAKEAGAKLYVLSLGLLKYGPKILEEVLNLAKESKSLILIDEAEYVFPEEGLVEMADDSQREFMIMLMSSLIVWITDVTQEGIPIVAGVGKPEYLNGKFESMADIKVLIDVSLPPHIIKSVFEESTNEFKMNLEVDYEKLSKALRGYDLTQTKELVRRAMIKALNEGRKTIRTEDVLSLVGKRPKKPTETIYIG